MLVLSRKVGEKIVIGNNITLVIQRIGKGRVAIAIDAPHEVPVLRAELAPFGVEVDGEVVELADEDSDDEPALPAKRAGSKPLAQSKGQGASHPGAGYLNSNAQTNPVKNLPETHHSHILPVG